jgi:uncharacterized protein
MLAIPSDQEPIYECDITQLRENIFFKALIPYMNKLDIKRIGVAIQQDSTVKQMTVKQLKNLIFYNSSLEKDMINTPELEILRNRLSIDNKIKTPKLYIIEINGENLKKIMRVEKYYNGTTYLWRKYINILTTSNKNCFYIPFFQMLTIQATVTALPDNIKVNVVIVGKLNDLIKVKAMQAIGKFVKDNPLVNQQPDVAWLIMSDKCNLHCVYCFESKARASKTVLNFDLAKQVLYKFDIGSKIIFFGGEPMLHIELMKQICEWGWEERNFNFCMVTNGQIIDRLFLRDYARYFANVYLSCDGFEYVQDICRGKGSFNKAMKFYHAFAEETGRYPILNPTVSRKGLANLANTIKWFYEIEYCKSVRFYPIKIADVNIWREEDFVLYEEQLVLIKDWYLENNIRKAKWNLYAFAKAEQEIFGMNEMTKDFVDKNFSCGTREWTVLPDGKMSPCCYENYSLSKGYKIDICEDVSKINYLSEFSIKDIPKCNTCPQWGCSPCLAKFRDYGGTSTTPAENYCRAGKILIDIARQYVQKIAVKSHLENEYNAYMQKHALEWQNTGEI